MDDNSEFSKKENKNKELPKQSSSRQKHKCPVTECRKLVIHLPRHLRQAHKWSQEKSKLALSTFDLRKRRKRKPEAKVSRSYKRRVCPLPKCSAVVRRLHNHLQGKHKMKTDDVMYQNYLKSSRFVELSDHSRSEEDEIISISSSSSTSPDLQKVDRKGGQAPISSSSDDEPSTSDISSMKRKRQIAKKEALAKNIMRFGRGNIKKMQEDSDELKSNTSTSSEEETSSSSKEENSSTPSVRPTLTRECRSLYKQLMHGQKGKSQPRTNKLDAEVLQPVLWNAASGDNLEQTEGDPSIDNRSGHSAERDSENDDESSECYVAKEEESSDEYETEDEEEIAEDNSNGAAKSNDNTEAVIDSFCRWLQGVDGGRRDKRTARQYASQVFSIVKAVAPSNLDINCLLISKKVRDKWLEPLEKKRRPGTCKAYLASLAKFLRFLMIDCPSSVITTQEAVRKCKEQVTEWMASYKAPIAKRNGKSRRTTSRNL